MQLLLDGLDSQRRYLNVVHNGKRTPRSLDEIFDPRTFDELKAITYVSSPKLFCKVAAGFKKVDLILGIDDSEVLDGFAQSVMHFFSIEERLRFWDNLTKDIQGKAAANHISVRFGKTNVVIHSKLYLMSSSTTGATRLIMGSANLSENAFHNKAQYEDIIIFDNSKLFELYIERFQEIYEDTLDYIPERVKRKAASEVVWTGDTEALKDILMEELEQNNARIHISEEAMLDVKGLPTRLSFRKQDIDVTSKVISLVTQKNKSGTFRVKNPAALKEAGAPLKALICRISKQSEGLDSRPFRTFMSDSGLVLSSDQHNDSSLLKPFSQRVSREELEGSLKTVEDFVDAFGRFTENPDLTNQSKVFEAILYAFVSPFLWKMRDDYTTREGRESVRAALPCFLFIGGRAGSGKTTTLEFISMLLGHRGHYSYQQVEKSMLDYFYTENQFPLLVDEIPISFFRSAAQYKGENLIKTVSNDISTKHPVLIGTTNLTDFNVSSQVLRRIYYLQIDRSFDKKKSSESTAHLYRILSEVNDRLFRDFTCRMGALIRDDKEFYSLPDFLSVARTVFRDYYRELDRTLPSWFPEELFDDYEERGRQLWGYTYSNYSGSFKDQGNGTLLVETERFCNDRRSKETYCNYLPTGCIKEDGVILVLDKERFLKYIGTRESRGLKKVIRRLLSGH